MDPISRREFVASAAALGTAAFVAPAFARRSASVLNQRAEPGIWGHGDHRFRVVPGWGAQAAKTIAVNDCHEMVQTADGRLFMFGNKTDNNMLIFNKDGNVTDTWGTDYPGGHGCTLHAENGEEFLYLTDPNRHQVIKTDLKGNVLLTLDAPLQTDQYTDANAYKPTETAIAPNGDIYVADGYGSQYLLHYSPKGELKGVYAGPGSEPNQFNNMHGVTLDTRDPANPTLICTARAQNGFKRFSLDGEHLSTVHLPGLWVCRAVVMGDLLAFAVIISGLDSWQSDRSGFVAILDADDKLISCPGATDPAHSPVNPDGSPSKYLATRTPDAPFMHPHDVCADRDGNLYVPQWASDQTYPVKLERV
ncbi:MAG: peptidylamidoglycolate lyase [Phycisphaerales bacterium]|jgi:peptidylamidoglycolate lyase